MDSTPQHPNVKDLAITYRLSLLWGLLMLLNPLVTLQAKELDLIPIIENFSDDIFGLEIQIWDIDQDKNGIIYAASNAGLYEYDGERWRFHQGGTGTNLRSILCDDDIIYTSGSRGYGYWEYDTNLNFIYHSLYIQDDKQDGASEEFWNIEETDEAVFFQSKMNLHIYNRSDKSISIIESKKGFDNLHKTNDDKIFIQDLDRGICQYQGTTLKALAGSSSFATSTSAIFSIEKDLYIVTDQSGVMLYTNQGFQDAGWSINATLQNEKVYCVNTDTRYGTLIGTVRHGLYLLDLNGDVTKHYNKKNGLQGNTILSIFLDKSDDIWLGIDGGISFVQESSPVQIVLDKQEEIGTIYSTLKKDDKIYLASNQGLYTLTQRDYSFDLDLIEGSVGQTWKLVDIDDHIFVGHHNGAYLIQNEELKKLSDVTGTWNFIQVPKRKDYIISGSYNGISLYQKEGEDWKFVNTITGFNESSRFLTFDHYGYLWVAHPVKGYYRISLDESYQRCEDVKFFGVKKDTLVEPLYLANIDNDIVFYNRYGFHHYNLLEESFEKYNYFNYANEENTPISSLTQVGNYYWFVAYNSLKCLERKGNEIIFHNQPLQSLNNHLLGDFTSITPIDDNTVIVGMRDGIALIDTRNMKFETSIPKLIIREIEQVGIEGHQNLIINDEKIITLENKYGNVRFYFASPSELKYSYKLQYKLTKYQEEWSEWLDQSHLDLIGLAAGEYTLEVRTKDLNEKFSVPLTYNLQIEKPYYLSNWLVIVYIVSLLLIIIAAILFFKKRAVNKELKANREEAIKLELKLEQAEKKALQVEKEKMILEENQLKQELNRINNELSSISMNNVKKNDLLMDLRKSVVSINNISQNPKVIGYSTKIASKIDRMLNSQDDWLTFELHFKNVHQGFFDRITQKYPTLTPSDLKLCAYLRLNLSTKEIASLINITPRSVEVARYRLRRKLDLNSNDNLIKHIMDI